MIWGIIIGTLILFLLLLLFFTSVRIRIVYRRKGEEDGFFLQVRWLWGLVRYRWVAEGFALTGQGLKVKEKKEGTTGTDKKKRTRIGLAAMKKAKEKVQDFRENVVNLYGVMRYFLSKVVCEKLVWISDLGTGDAAETGIITGLAWGIKANLVGVVGSYFQWRRPPQLDIRPYFIEARLETDLECIFRFKVRHAILAVMRLLLRMNNKGGEGKWQNTLFKA
ncbi:DUF2953 domain-containing protein [Salinithrix halophila]|uniref:DUF2953 domain-containing protein n=1 Tax=Salinithrix halophila TaxID=1485204 RepID=UPI0036D43E8E